MKRAKQHALVAVKILFICGVAALIYQKTDVENIWAHVKNLNLSYAIAAFALGISSQCISALRTRFYFSSIELPLRRRVVLPIYFIGALFNVALPGGIGGDAYKIYLVHKFTKISKTKLFQMILADRASGLLLLVAIAVCLAYWSDIPAHVPFATIGLAGFLLLTCGCYAVGVRFFTKERPRTAMIAGVYSFAVQAVGTLAAWCLLESMAPAPFTTTEMINYLVVFLLATVASILPISIGGAGVRELVFLLTAPMLGLDKEFGIAFAMMIFVMNTLPASIGIPLWYYIDRIYTAYDSRVG